MKYRIVTLTNGVFEPCLYVDGVEPLFTTEQEAREALAEHHHEMEEAVMDGDLPDYEFDADSIVEAPLGYIAKVQG